MTEDKINVGNIVNSVGVAIGRGARATVNLFQDQSAVRHKRERDALLAMMQEFWIEGVLKRARFGSHRLQVPFRATTKTTAGSDWFGLIDTLENETHGQVEASTIPDLFFAQNELQRSLLLLGEAGGGKTITMLEISEQAIAAARNDATLPIPVIFHLSTWAQRQESLSNWLQEEFLAKYSVPRDSAKEWIADQQLVLLLDGLDELPIDQIEPCIIAINQFHAQFGMPIIVCCRPEVYETLATQLNLHCTAQLQRLPPEEVLIYLATVDVKALDVVKSDVDLLEMAQNPLMLNTLLRAHAGLSSRELQDLHAAADKQRFLFNAYIEHMFPDKGSSTHYSEESTRFRLGWLAQRTREQGESIFQIERMQPGWLVTRREQWQYALGTRLGYGLLFGILCSIVLIMSNSRVLGVDLFSGATIPSVIMAAAVFVAWLGAGALLGGTDALWGHRSGPNSTREWLRQVGTYVGSICIGFILVFFLVIVGYCTQQACYMPTEKEGRQLMELPDTIATGLNWGFFYGLLFGILLGLFLKLSQRSAPMQQEIRTVEQLRFSAAGAGRGILFGLCVGGLLGLGLDWLSGYRFFDWFLIFGLPKASIIRRLLASFALVGPVIALLGVLFGGFNGVVLNAKVRPNQGMWLSARNALLAGVICAVIGWGLALLYHWVGLRIAPEQSTQLATGGPLGGIVVGLLFGTLAALWHGGLDLIQHGILRLILYRRDIVPWNYAQFLAYCVDRSFLRQVGGGYIFVNRLLLEHFAKADSNDNDAQRLS